MARLTTSDYATGDFLVERGMISLAQLDAAIAEAERWEISLVDVVMSKRWVQPFAFYKTLAKRYDLDFVDLREDAPDPALMDPADAETYARELSMPWRRIGDAIVVATARPGPESIIWARRKFGPGVRLKVCSKFDILWSLQREFREEQSHLAVYDLAEMDPVMSAATVFTPAQIIFAYAVFTAFVGGLAFAPVVTLIVLNAIMSFFYLGNFIFKGLLVWYGGLGAKNSARIIEADARLLHDEDLPVYTVLVPMFREPEVLPILANALRQLDYPLAKLDIKIVLEEGDHETIDAAKSLGLESIFEIIRVPASKPQTKPKACNYALRFARGSLLVIFDAEDKPEPDQLKKVVAAFRRAPANTACVQCRLNYYNASENWLTRMFTLDYSLWFDLMLPGLERMKVPIPLGGTSNHFKIDVLRELHAWDPFNVTEDADLGIRMTQKGYRVSVIESTTFEEANCSSSNWVRQRSRWIKGYMQTFLVHTRRPLHLAKSVGPLGIAGFVFFIGGTMLAGLLNPLFWGVFAFWLITRLGSFDIIFPPILLYLSIFNLLLGNGLFMYLMMIAPLRRRWVELSPFALTVIWYWVLMSVAAWKGLWQLLHNPFYWEKTDHGISKHTASELAIATAAETPQAQAA